MGVEASSAAESLIGLGTSLRRDGRRRKRLKLSLCAHIRPFDPGFEEIEETAEVADFSNDGLCFRTRMPHYFVGMRLLVAFPYGEKVPATRTFLVSVVRVDHQGDGWRQVAVQVLPRPVPGRLSRAG